MLQYNQYKRREGFQMKRTDKEVTQPSAQERSRRRASNETRYDELLDRALRRKQYEKRYGRGDY
jgi:hypothetical protein